MLKPNEIARKCILNSMSGETKNKTNDKKADTKASCTQILISYLTGTQSVSIRMTS
jgi:hypothetical protein